MNIQSLVSAAKNLKDKVKKKEEDLDVMKKQLEDERRYSEVIQTRLKDLQEREKDQSNKYRLLLEELDKQHNSSKAHTITDIPSDFLGRERSLGDGQYHKSETYKLPSSIPDVGDSSIFNNMTKPSLQIK